MIKNYHQVWLVWLSGMRMNMGLQTQRLLVQVPVRAHAWVEGQVPGLGACKTQYIDVFLPLPSL